MRISVHRIMKTSCKYQGTPPWVAPDAPNQDFVFSAGKVGSLNLFEFLGGEKLPHNFKALKVVCLKKNFSTQLQEMWSRNLKKVLLKFTFMKSPFWFQFPQPRIKKKIVSNQPTRWMTACCFWPSSGYQQKIIGHFVGSTQRRVLRPPVQQSPPWHSPEVNGRS